MVFRNHMSHENEAKLKKSISDERKWGETLETYLVNNIAKNVDINIKKVKN